MMSGHNNRADLVMVKRALEERWEIPEQTRQKLPQVLYDIVISEANDREKIRACEVLGRMHQSNIDNAVMCAKLEMEAGVERTKIVIEYEHREARDG